MKRNLFRYYNKKNKLLSKRYELFPSSSKQRKKRESNI